jgi:hypothetical protein
VPSNPNTGVCPLLFFSSDLVNLLLLIDAELARAAVDQEKQTADDGQNLEEVVLGKILVGVVLVKLREKSC